MTVTEPNPSFFQSVLDWLRKGYPEGIPPTDYYPLLALLKRTLTEEELIQAASTLLRESRTANPVTDSQIRRVVREVIEKEPNVEEINQVAARLAMVGWPLADHC
jgi:hypothetical protein